MEKKIMNKKELIEFYKTIMETKLSYCVEPIGEDKYFVITYNANIGENSNG